VADLWKHLFDSEWKQRDDIESVQSSVTSAMHDNVRLSRQLRAAEDKVERLELVVEALVTVLELRGGLDRQELALAIERIDLEDGVVDGRMGPDRTANAPKCAACGRPVNPQREACLFCGGARDASKPTRPPTRTVSCRRCQRDVPESTTYFTELGITCADCYVP